jgi:acyl-CoA hydrolase
MISIAHPDFREELERQAHEAKLLIPACNPENL